MSSTIGKKAKKATTYKNPSKKKADDKAAFFLCQSINYKNYQYYVRNNLTYL
jgi:hypothetical protein